MACFSEVSELQQPTVSQPRPYLTGDVITWTKEYKASQLNKHRFFIGFFLMSAPVVN